MKVSVTHEQAGTMDYAQWMELITLEYCVLHDKILVILRRSGVVLQQLE